MRIKGLRIRTKTQNTIEVNYLFPHYQKSNRIDRTTMDFIIPVTFDSVEALEKWLFCLTMTEKESEMAILFHSHRLVSKLVTKKRFKKIKSNLTLLTRIANVEKPN